MGHVIFKMVAVCLVKQDFMERNVSLFVQTFVRTMCAQSQMALACLVKVDIMDTNV